MAEQDKEFVIRVFGGLNVSDQEDQLVMRSHRETQGGFAQFSPAESPDLINIDFTKVGFKKRLGSTELLDLSGVLVGSDVLIAGVEFRQSAGSVRYEIVVSKKTIYISADGAAFAQINASGGGAYTHAADVAKVGFATTDGHLFIGLDGANQIQTFKEGADLDPAMSNGNTYEEAYSASTHVMEGTWATGCYLLTVVHSRLVFSNGDGILYYTPMAYTTSSGIWKLGSTFFFPQGRILSLDNMSPEYSDSLKQVLYVGTEVGFEVLTGFANTDELARIEGTKAPLNHQSVAISKNWLVYMTNEKNIYGINKTTVIDLGRRLKNDGADGPLDSMSLSDSLTNGFGVYSDDKEQAYFFFSTVSTKFNDTCIALDFKLGEPTIGEPQSSFEQRVRCLHWEIKTPVDNDWFTHVYKKRGSMVGITTSATYGTKTWTFLNDNDDLDALAVETSWKSPIFLAGGERTNKQFGELAIRSLPKGSHSVSVNIFINRANGSSKSFDFSQFDSGFGLWDTEGVWDTAIWQTTQFVKGIRDVDLYADSIQWEVKNFNTDEPFDMANMSLVYMDGSSER